MKKNMIKSSTPKRNDAVGWLDTGTRECRAFPDTSNELALPAHSIEANGRNGTDPGEAGR